MSCRTLLAFIASCTAGLAAAGAIAAEPSSDCGAPPERAPDTFQVAGRERHAIVVVPEGYQADRPHALVFGFHGRTNDNVQARAYFGLEEAANGPAIYVYPAALTDRSGRFTWTDPGDPPDALRDFALFDAIVERITSAYCIDLNAIYVVGHSLGASFANSLACARADRIRGLASVAGGITPSDCSGDVAALLMHNPRDRAVPLSEGERARDVLLGHPGDQNKVVRRRFGGFECRQYGDREHPLLWCVHAQDFTPHGRFYPHQWPEGATQSIIRFFETLAARTTGPASALGPESGGRQQREDFWAAPQPNGMLVKGLAHAHRCQRVLEKGQHALASAERISSGAVSPRSATAPTASGRALKR